MPDISLISVEEAEHFDMKRVQDRKNLLCVKLRVQALRVKKIIFIDPFFSPGPFTVNLIGARGRKRETAVESHK